MDSRQHIEIALRAGQVAKAALELAGTHADLSLRLMCRVLIEEVDGLIGAVNAASEKVERPANVSQHAPVRKPADVES